MKKLLKGIAAFRRSRPADHAARLAKLAKTQAPEAMLICCSDSRVAPDVFATVEPGDLIVVRNIGNLVPHHRETRSGWRSASVAAALELAIETLHVSDVIVCGHSECAAMRAITAGNRLPHAPHLKAWLRHGESARVGLKPAPRGLKKHDHVSQQSALLQLEHLRSYPVVRDAEKAGRLRLHAWWFDIRRAEVLSYDVDAGRFVPLDVTPSE